MYVITSPFYQCMVLLCIYANKSYFRHLVLIAGVMEHVDLGTRVSSCTFCIAVGQGIAIVNSVQTCNSVTFYFMKKLIF